MNVGQRVMLIANHNLTDMEPPRIGSVGEIAEALDWDGDYMVSFPDHPCTVGEPEWFIPASFLIPIDEPPRREDFEIANDALLAIAATHNTRHAPT